METVSYTHLPEICKCADIGVISSLREGLGLSGIEMLAAGLPIVASNVHGIVDYVKDGENGYLANPNSAGEFADAIQKLNNGQIRNVLAQACSQSVETFDAAYSHEAMRKIYEETLA